MPHEVTPPAPSPLYPLAHLKPASRTASRVLTFAGSVRDFRKWIKLLVKKP